MHISISLCQFLVFSFRSFALKYLISLQNYNSFDRKKSEFDIKVLTKAHNPPSLFLIFNASLLNLYNYTAEK